MRSGTLDVPAIASFAVAGRLAAERREHFARRVGGLRTTWWPLCAMPSRTPSSAAIRTRPGGSRPTRTSASRLRGRLLLLLLDAQGIECSTGSACTAGIAQPSHVLLATGTDPDLARGTLRFSLGHTSTEEDVKALAQAIGPAVERARTAGLS